MGREWISFNREDENGNGPRYSLSLFFVSCCVHACIHGQPVSSQLPEKLLHFSLFFLLQRKFIFYKPKEELPPIIFICSDKHQLLLLPLRIHEMKNEDMLTCRRRGNAVRWFSCENFRYIHSACHFIILESSLQTSEKSSSHFPSLFLRSPVGNTKSKLH